MSAAKRLKQKTQGDNWPEGSAGKGSANNANIYKGDNCKKGEPDGKEAALRLLRQANRLKQLGAYHSSNPQVGKPTGDSEPPAPPLALTPALAADPETAIVVLPRIARDEPELRRWLVINPKADASLLENTCLGPAAPV